MNSLSLKSNPPRYLGRQGRESVSIGDHRLHLDHLGGPLPFEEVHTFQKACRDWVRENSQDGILIACEHAPVITLGLRSNRDHLKNLGIELVALRRGGFETYHGPGQLMLYPILHLPSWKLGVRAYIKMMQTILRTFLQEHFNVETAKIDDCGPGGPGLYIDCKKLASIGIHIQHGVSIHGLCLNLTQESLKGFQGISPCGASNLEMTCLEKLSLRDNLKKSVFESASDGLSRMLADALRVGLANT